MSLLFDHKIGQLTVVSVWWQLLLTVLVVHANHFDVVTGSDRIIFADGHIEDTAEDKATNEAD